MADCTLHTAQCTLHTAPAKAVAPAFAPVHFLLRMEKCTLHTIYLYQMQHMYHLTLPHCCLNEGTWWSTPSTYRIINFLSELMNQCNELMTRLLVEQPRLHWVW